MILKNLPRLGAGLFALCFAGESFGNSTDWNIGYNGYWTDLAAWDNGVPQSGDTANFGQTYDGNDVYLPTTTQSMAALVNIAGSWNFAGGDLNADAISVTGLGGSQFTSASVTAGTFTTSSGYGSVSFGSKSSLSVTGSGQALTVGGNVNMYFYSSSLQVTNDSLLDGSGEIQLDGTSTANFDGNLTVGYATSGTFLSYGFGASKPSTTVGGDMNVATLAASSSSVSLYDSTLKIDGNLNFGMGGYTWTQNNASVTVVGGLTIVGGVSQVNVDQQSSLTVDGLLDLSGYLSVNGTLNANGGLDLNPNGYLKGTGTINGSVTNLGGTLHAGDGAGVLQVVGDYSADKSSTTAFLFDSSGPSELTVSGAATLDGLLQLDVMSGYVYQPNVWIDVLDAQGGLSGTFSGFAWTGGGNWLVSYDANDVYVKYAATPEPSSLLALGAGFMGLLVRRRRSKLRASKVAN